MNLYLAAMLLFAGLAALLIALGPSLLPLGLQRSLAALLIGLLAGFATIALPMLMLPAFAIGSILSMNYVRNGRLRDTGLLLAGAGLVWTTVWGRNAWNAAVDPAVTSSDAGFFLAIGVGMLVGGVAFIIRPAAARRPRA
ncbi:MAG: hypothetical protein ABI534_01255 [Chloroflexota bacterium]